jgi:hypothetical protein
MEVERFKHRHAPPAVDLEVAAGLGRSETEQRAWPDLRGGEGGGGEHTVAGADAAHLLPCSNASPPPCSVVLAVEDGWHRRLRRGQISRSARVRRRRPGRQRRGARGRRSSATSAVELSLHLDAPSPDPELERHRRCSCGGAASSRVDLHRRRGRGSVLETAGGGSTGRRWRRRGEGGRVEELERREREWSQWGRLRCGVPRVARRGGAASFCSRVCTTYWSLYSSLSLCILGIQHVLHKPLETVSSPDFSTD